MLKDMIYFNVTLPNQDQMPISGTDRNDVEDSLFELGFDSRVISQTKIEQIPTPIHFKGK